ncbi:hypothetical protein DFQ26_000975 [Actinomortierella ambigua]|nr:hypothetical protein DFQ26_000975 [Actinomortierella ambigua]
MTVYGFGHAQRSRSTDVIVAAAGLIVAIVNESASYLASLKIPVQAAATRSNAPAGRSGTNRAFRQGATPRNVPHAVNASHGPAGASSIPECLRVAAQKGTLSLASLREAVAILEKNPQAVTTTHVEELVVKVKAIGTHQPSAFGTPGGRTTAFSTSARTAAIDGRSGYSSFRYINRRRLQQLETEAVANPHDAQAQAEFYKELLKIEDYTALINRFESAKYASSEASLQYYATALARTNQTDQIVPRILQRLRQQPLLGADAEATAYSIGQGFRRGAPTSPSALSEPAAVAGTNSTVAGGGGGGVAIEQMSEAFGAAGNKGNPIYVVMDESKTSKGYMLWRGLRWVGITVTYAFCILTFLSLVFENSGLMKPTPTQTEFEPSADNNAKFSDVHGCDESKQELEEVVEFLKDPNKYNQLGGKLPKGVLLTGPPGTGKTMLARAVAGEAGVPFFFMSGSEFDEMYVGVGARRVRELFAAARARAPSIVFIDELDAIGARRNPKDQTYMKQTLNQLLVELDGFSQTEGVIIIAATNFPELLDKALVRPGRFDRHVSVPLPDVRGRMQILKHHLKNINVANNVDISVIARGTPGFSGADLANLVNQAAIQASREGVSEVGVKQIEYAKDKILMGVERRSQVVTSESKKLTAYHEGGHALVALFTPGAMPLHKATIMPRGSALGVTVQLPDMDKDSFTRKEYMAQLDVAMGGRVAEEMIFGADNVTSGCSSDIVHATKVARMMVTHYGMSDKVGPVAHTEEDMATLSTPTKQLIEAEIKALVEAAQARAAQLLKTHKEELHRLAKALVEYETLTQEEIRRAIEGRPIVR